ncbi:MAG: glutamine synthetase [Treponema sp.]|nr:glutamine synthetase [Treponema sp.]
MYTEQEAIQYVRENDVRFIKLFFTDFYGSIKSISIQPSELERAFSKGITFDASSVKGFLGYAESDLFIVPDPSTLAVLPWRPQSGRVVRFFCSVRYPDGTPFEVDTRKMLSELVEKARSKGFDFNVGTECEFYLFKCDEKGNPTKEPYDMAGYCDLAPRDKGENVRREICLTLEQMGVHPEASYHEEGPGQNEVDFKYSDVLNAADNLQTFKIVVKTIAARNGLFASFMPKPLSDKPGNGLHINISLYKDGKNLFAGDNFSDEAKSFLAGILFRTLEIAPFTNPIPNSYMRLGTFEAPKYISWSRQNRSQLIRIPSGDEEAARMEFRASDPAGNPYIDLYLLLSAGLEGIEKHYELPEATDIDFFNADPEETRFMIRLPMSLGEAKKYCEKGDFIYKVFPKMLLDFLGKNENETAEIDRGEI